nr:hypothetical protein [Gammaproteobacteria bacterium]
MQNNNDPDNNQNEQPVQVNSKNSMLFLAACGLVIGILLAFYFASHETGSVNKAPAHSAEQAPDKQDSHETDGPLKQSKLSAHSAKSVSIATEDNPKETVKRVYGKREQLNVLPEPKLHPRAESEWQGMLVDTSLQAICEGENSCGLAMACIDNHCGPCSNDSQCGTGEICVLDHCLVAEKTACRAASDCGTGELCVLNGYSDDPRGNQQTRSYCQASKSGQQQSKEQIVNADIDEPGPEVTERPVSMDQLHDALLEYENQQSKPMEQVQTPQVQ